MAYFKPVKDYQKHLIKKAIKKYNIISPFLEVGCGNGEFLQFLSKFKYSGIGIDKSKKSIRIAKKRKLKNIKIINYDLFKFIETDRFNFILMIDVLEHIKDDVSALKKIKRLLSRDGILIFQVPSHRRKYSWIDANYGHYRRYDKEDIYEVVRKSNLKIIEIWCSGFPFISIMEDSVAFAGKILKKLTDKKNNMDTRTSKSGLDSPIRKNLPLTETLFNKIFNITILWKLLFSIMDKFLLTNLGSTFFVIVRNK